MLYWTGSGEQLYLRNYTKYKHWTFTIVLLRTCKFRRILYHSPRERLVVSTLKYSEIYCQIKVDETWSTFKDTSQCPKQLRQQKLGGQPTTSRVLPQRSNRVVSDNTQNSPNIAMSELHFFLTDYNSRTKLEAPNLELTVRGIHTIDGADFKITCGHQSTPLE